MLTPGHLPLAVTFSVPCQSVHDVLVRCRFSRPFSVSAGHISMLTPGHLPFVVTFLILIVTLIVTLILILVRTVSTIRRPDPISGIASADKEGAPDVLGAARDQFCALKFSTVLLLTISCSKLFQSLVHGSRPISVRAGCAQLSGRAVACRGCCWRCCRCGWRGRLWRRACWRRSTRRSTVWWKRRTRPRWTLFLASTLTDRVCHTSYVIRHIPFLFSEYFS